MSIYSERDYLTSQIIKTEYLLGLVGNHPLMSFGLKDKLDKLKKELEELKQPIQEPKIRLLFSGNAVNGSLGVKASFIGTILKPFQELVKTQTSYNRFGTVNKRGISKRSVDAELYLTALPTGSFGVELRQLNIKDLFSASDVSNALDQIVKLIDTSSKSDESFEKAIEEMPKRNLSNLKQFLKGVSGEKSFLKLETNTLQVVLNENIVNETFHRVDSTNSTENYINIQGVLRGFLLNSGKFELSSKGEKINGQIGKELTEEDVLNYTKHYNNKECNIFLCEHKVMFKTGKTKIVYELLEIKPIQ